jgi:hypothetical protein
MWEKPWTPGHVSHYPFVDGLDLGSGVDFLRGVWDRKECAMVVTLRSWVQSVKKCDSQVIYPFTRIIFAENSAGSILFFKTSLVGCLEYI